MDISNCDDVTKDNRQFSSLLQLENRIMLLMKQRKSKNKAFYELEPFFLCVNKCVKVFCAVTHMENIKK